MKTHLYSPGGSGYTYLKSILDWGNAAIINNPHQRGALFQEGEKFVYIFANPYDVLLSFERRRYLHDINAVGLMQGDVNYFRTYGCKGLDHYLGLKKDCFRFGQHSNAYYTNPHLGLFVKYEALAERMDDIRDWSGLEFTQQVPFSRRSSNHAVLGKEMLKELYAAHGRWYDHYRRLPGFFTNKPEAQACLDHYVMDCYENAA